MKIPSKNQSLSRQKAVTALQTELHVYKQSCRGWGTGDTLNKKLKNQEQKQDFSNM